MKKRYMGIIHTKKQYIWIENIYGKCIYMEKESKWRRDT